MMQKSYIELVALAVYTHDSQLWHRLYQICYCTTDKQMYHESNRAFCKNSVHFTITFV